MRLLVNRETVFYGRHRRKVKALSVFILLWFLVIAVRLVELQVIQHKKLKAEVMEQSQDLITVMPTRGTIYDRNGKILARSLPAVSVFFSPVKTESLESQLRGLEQLKKLLNLSETDLARIRASAQKKKRFIWVKRKISPDLAEQVKRLKLPGIYFLEEYKRFYPQGSLAAHVLGGVSIDDTGLAGVEYYYDSRLRGEEGQQLIMKDARRREFYIETIKETRPGHDLYLTIDSTIQYIAEKELRLAVERFQADWGTVVISVPWTGEILAMASYPNYDPNFFPPQEKAMMNRAIQHTYEPGSTAKIVTAAAARELGGLSWNSHYDCRQGFIVFGGTTVRDHVRLGILSFPEVFIHSSNVGVIKIAEQLGEDRIYRMFKTFRFGEKTGIDLPGEESGVVHPLEKWRKSSLRVAMGYEMAATPLQILQAMNVLATSGYLVKPKVSLDRPRPLLQSAGNLSVMTEEAELILNPKTARELVDLVFRQVVEIGTGRQALIPGYTLAGKTGTTQKFDPELRAYNNSRHVASFVGFVPADRPLFSMVVVIDEPRGPLHYGGQVAAPVFREIARRVLLYMNQPPQKLPDNLLVARKEIMDTGVTD